MIRGDNLRTIRSVVVDFAPILPLPPIKLGSVVLFAPHFLVVASLALAAELLGWFEQGLGSYRLRYGRYSDGCLRSTLSESIQCGPGGAQVTDHRPEGQRGRDVQQDFADPEYRHYPEVVLV